MKVVLTVLVMTLAGCAATPEEARQRLPYLSEFQVCEGAILARPEVAMLAQQEANRRGLDCSRYASAVMQQQQNQNAAVQNYIQSLNPPAQPFRPMVNCTSYRRGNNVETECR